MSKGKKYCRKTIFQLLSLLFLSVGLLSGKALVKPQYIKADTPASLLGDANGDGRVV